MRPPPPTVIVACFLDANVGSAGYRVNLVQSEHHSPAYAYRLEKYAYRGFAIGLPGLDVPWPSPDLDSVSYVWTKKRNSLLQVLPGSDEDAPGLSLITMQAGSKPGKVRHVHCRKQKAKQVAGVLGCLMLPQQIGGRLGQIELWQTIAFGRF